MNVHRIHDGHDRSSPSAHLTEIEVSHQQVELCMSALEGIMTRELSDIGAFNAARLRLRQANLVRTQVALEAARHLVERQAAQLALEELQRAELDYSRGISEHVRLWTVAAIERDWDGYCRATMSILKGARDMIAAERLLLCPVLRAAARLNRGVASRLSPAAPSAAP